MENDSKCAPTLHSTVTATPALEGRPESREITPEPFVFNGGTITSPANGAPRSNTPRDSLLAVQQADQRANARYPINLALQYKLLHGRVDRLGSGRTLNISSRGVLFEVDNSCPAGGEIELKMDWPFRLEGLCCLKLVMRGRVVRYDAKAKAVAVKAEHYEFRTARANSV